MQQRVNVQLILRPICLRPSEQRRRSNNRYNAFLLLAGFPCPSNHTSKADLLADVGPSKETSVRIMTKSRRKILRSDSLALAGSCSAPFGVIQCRLGPADLMQRLPCPLLQRTRCAGQQCVVGERERERDSESAKFHYTI